MAKKEALALAVREALNGYIVHPVDENGRWDKESGVHVFEEIEGVLAYTKNFFNPEEKEDD